MRITDVDVVGRSIPIADEFPVSYEAHTETEHVFVRLRTDDDMIGYGEGTALPWFTGETTSSMAAFVEEWLAPRLLGSPLDDACRDLTAFAEAFPGNPGAKTAVDLALLDLRGKRAGVPVHELLGGAVHDTLPLIYPVPGVTPDRARELTDVGLEEGFERFKIKATGDVDSDVERIDAVLSRLPEGATARVDANTAWKTAPTTIRVVAEIETPERIEYLEQPVSRDRPGDLRRVWEETGIPVYADEFVHGPRDVERLGTDGLAAGVHLKLAKSGSLWALAHMARTARYHGMNATPVSAFGTSLEATAILHLAATVPNLPLACELDPRLVATDPTDRPLDVAPEVPRPDDPGLGVELVDVF